MEREEREERNRKIRNPGESSDVEGGYKRERKKRRERDE